jgi:uncharacterized protein (DUF488 family)
MVERCATIWTVGHSTRSLDEFLGLLTGNGIEALADIRRFASSRKFPHFNQAALSRSLHRAGIAYLHLPELGGRRQPRADSSNTAWRNKSFRGYADYMETDAFRAGVDKVLNLAQGKHTAVMCAEAVWWRCHRALLADYLKSLGIEVMHILAATKVVRHPYTSAAKLSHGRLSYVSGRLASAAVASHAFAGRIK